MTWQTNFQGIEGNEENEWTLLAGRDSSNANILRVLCDGERLGATAMKEDDLRGLMPGGDLTAGLNFLFNHGLIARDWELRLVRPTEKGRAFDRLIRLLEDA